VKSACADGLKGKLLVCGRKSPDWFGELPGKNSCETALDGLCLDDIKAFVRMHGFDDGELSNLKASFRLHPFVLHLLLYLSRKQSIPLGEFLASVGEGNVELELLKEVYEDLDEQHRSLLDHLSVLRTAFVPRAIKVFSADKVSEDVVHKVPFSLLVVDRDGDTFILHPLVKNFGKDHLAGHSDVLEQCHRTALDYYGPAVLTRGKRSVIAALETGYHMLELGQNRDALDVLSGHCRGIISFGYGWELKSFTARIDGSGIVDGDCDDLSTAQALRELSAIYVYLPSLVKSDHHLKAIRYCGKAIAFFDEQDDPVERANTLNVLGMACSRLPVGDPRKNIDRAFQSYKDALVIFNEYGLHGGSAMVHNNMGAAWIRLAEYGGEWCFNRALGHLKQAVRLYKENSVDSLTQAEVESNLGYVYCILGKTADGMQHFKSALWEFSEDNFPMEYAHTQQQLGSAYRLDSTGVRTSRLNTAIEYYAEALRIFEEGVFPVSFGECQHTLAIVHRQLGMYQSKDFHLKLAIKCYNNSLRVYREASFPNEYRTICDHTQAAYPSTRQHKHSSQAP